MQGAGRPEPRSCVHRFRSPLTRTARCQTRSQPLREDTSDPLAGAAAARRAVRHRCKVRTPTSQGDDYDRATGGPEHPIARRWELAMPGLSKQVSTRPSRPSQASRRRWLQAALSLSAAGPLAAQAPPAGATRVALVIGNAAYPQTPLRNAVNDARSVAEVLRAQGFAVLSVHDADRAQMEAAVARAREALHGRSGVGLLYFAGHGLQLQWRNYMVPIDARIEQGADVPAQSVDVQHVLDAFRAAGNRMNIVVLDACRDNPFGEVASGRGLAQMDAPPGTFLAYATAPGHVAEDGTFSSGNGPYAHFLVQELRRPEARIEEVFKRVRFAVRRHTAGRQVPWESTSLEDDFSFARGIVEPLRPGARQRDAAFEEELAEWNRIRESNDVDDFYRFLARFPSGLFSELAQLRIERLQRPAARPRPGPSGVSAPDTSARRFEVGDVIWYEIEDQLQNSRRNVRLRVTAADDERAEFNGGSFVLTQTGGLVKNQFGSFDPPIVELVPDMAPGRRWRSAFLQTHEGKQYRTFYESRVVAVEEIMLQPGPVKAFRVEHHGEALYPDGRMASLRRTTWVDVARGMVVRSDAEFGWAGAPPRQGGRVWFRSVTRLVGEQRRPR